MILTFLSPEDLSAKDIPLPVEVLKQSPWVLEIINAPFLAGKEKESDHSYGPLSAEELDFRRNPKLKKGEPATEDEIKVVGDISGFLNESSAIIIAETRDFRKAEERARLLGYRPANAGEFLQMLWYMKSEIQNNHGWYYCYQGRAKNYAILACFDRKGDIKEIIFDTHYDSLDYMGGNMESLCFFVSESQIPCHIGIREISEEEEGHRFVPVPGLHNTITSKRNSVEPEPIGTIVLMAFRITGYIPDCDGSLMANLKHINKDGDGTGWRPGHIGLSSDSELVVTPEKLKELFEKK